MNNKNSILSELETVAPTLINVPKTLPYSLQNGYFDSLSANILNKIRLIDQSSINSFSIETQKTVNPFTIPNGYFDNLVDNVLSMIKLEQNDSIKSFTPADIKNPYKIPADYFDTLPSEILQKISVLENEKPLEEISFGIGLNRITPYKVPNGYFVALSDEILVKVLASELENENRIDKYFFKKVNPYKVPVNYFEGLCAEIIAKKNLLENEDFASIHFTKNNPYKTPTGYFDRLANEILGKIKTSENEESIISKYFTKVNPYQVPTGYFEGLANDILFKINPSKHQEVPVSYFEALPSVILQKIRSLEVDNELEQIAPLLNTINKTPINHVPTGYFDDLQPNLPQVAPTKVIGFKKKTNWFKNAVAACLIGTLGFTAYQLMDESTKPVSVIQTLSSENVGTPIPVANINVDEELSKVDDASLAKYLNNIEMPTEQVTAHFQDVNSGDVDEALQDISDEAIQQHLDETGELPNKKN